MSQDLFWNFLWAGRDNWLKGWRLTAQMQAPDWLAASAWPVACLSGSCVQLWCLCFFFSLQKSLLIVGQNLRLAVIGSASATSCWLIAPVLVLDCWSCRIRDGCRPKDGLPNDRRVSECRGGASVSVWSNPNVRNPLGYWRGIDERGGDVLSWVEYLAVKSCEASPTLCAYFHHYFDGG